ncbi:nucleic acid-binding protein, partial [Natronorubrum sp. A-ect3]|uniref:nucleic acid-binding protein n=1 Tax=Natronorubrum sp. A-ect3 TaxID=3242698 RepID=UPI00359CD3B9
VTWTKSTATPPGVREPNTLAIVEFDVEGTAVRAIVQLTTDDVETGDEVEPVYVEELREPGAGIREPESQDWDGYRFEPV